MERSDRIYTENEIRFAAFFGGPVAGAYLIAKNFKVFGQPSRALWSMIVGIGIMALFLVVILTIPGAEKLPNYVLPVAFGLIAYFVTQHCQGVAIREHLDSGRAAFGWARTIFVSLGIAALTFLLPFAALVAYSFVTDRPVSKTYGRMQHEVTFDKNNITEAEVDRIADAFTVANFFDEKDQKTIDVTKKDKTYEIAISCNDSVRNDPDALKAVTELRNDVQKMFPSNPIVFNLSIGTPDNVVKRLE